MQERKYCVHVWWTDPHTSEPDMQVNVKVHSDEAPGYWELVLETLFVYDLAFVPKISVEDLNGSERVLSTFCNVTSPV